MGGLGSIGVSIPRTPAVCMRFGTLYSPRTRSSSTWSAAKTSANQRRFVENAAPLVGLRGSRLSARYQLPRPETTCDS
jgi:hypothetical protein